MNKGKVDVLLGLQWGDEGKGKVVDVLTPKYEVLMLVIPWSLKARSMCFVRFHRESSRVAR